MQNAPRSLHHLILPLPCQLLGLYNCPRMRSRRRGCHINKQTLKVVTTLSDVCVFVHVGPENITVGCPNLLQGDSN